MPLTRAAVQSCIWRMSGHGAPFFIAIDAKGGVRRVDFFQLQQKLSLFFAGKHCWLLGWIACPDSMRESIYGELQRVAVTPLARPLQQLQVAQEHISDSLGGSPCRLCQNQIYR